MGADHGREVLDDSPDNASDPWAAQALACLLVDLDAGPLGGLSAA